MALFYSLFCSLLILLMILALFFHVRATKELISLLMLALVMPVFDVYVPSMIYSFSGMVVQPAPWIEPIQIHEIIQASILYTGCLMVFFAGFYTAFKISGVQLSRRGRVAGMPGISLNVGLVYFFLSIAITWYLMKLIVEIGQYDSFASYVSSKLMTRWKPKPLDSGTFLWILHRGAEVMKGVILCLSGVLFFYRKVYGRKFLWGVVVPLVPLIIAISSFSRGAVLVWFIGFAMLEALRINCQEPENALRTNRKMVVMLFIAALSFMAYGAVRTYFSSVEWGASVDSDQAVVSELKKTFKGSGLVGFVSVYKHFSKHDDYLYGKTIKDILLLPIPRSIYLSKPEWYGIDDITRKMGWPPSTQSAVTMPGELFANFGYLGLPFMIVFGAIFGVMYGLRYKPRFMFIYAFIAVPTLLISFWMSLTGLINSIKIIPVIYIVLVICLSRRTLKLNEAVV